MAFSLLDPETFIDPAVRAQLKVDELFGPTPSSLYGQDFNAQVPPPMLPPTANDVGPFPGRQYDQWGNYSDDGGYTWSNGYIAGQDVQPAPPEPTADNVAGWTPDSALPPPPVAAQPIDYSLDFNQPMPMPQANPADPWQQATYQPPTPFVPDPRFAGTSIGPSSGEALPGGQSWEDVYPGQQYGDLGPQYEAQNAAIRAANEAHPGELAGWSIGWEDTPSVLLGAANVAGSFRGATGHNIEDIPGLGWTTNVPYLPETLDTLASPASLFGAGATGARLGLAPLIGTSARTAAATVGAYAGSDLAGNIATGLNAPEPIVTASELIGGLGGGIAGWKAAGMLPELAGSVKSLPANLSKYAAEGETSAFKGALDPETGLPFEAQALHPTFDPNAPPVTEMSLSGAAEPPSGLTPEQAGMPPPESVQAGRVPPTLAPVDNPIGPSGFHEAELGDAGARAAIATKEATTATAGPLGEAVGKIPGVKPVAGVVNPSIGLERPIHVTNQAEAAVRADLQTQFAATRKPLVQEIDDAFRIRPEYVGPAENPIKGTFIDIAENPHDYRLTPKQQDIIDRMAARDADNVNLVRSEYGADVGLYAPKNEGAAYMTHVNTNDDLLTRIDRTAESMSRVGVAKERSWDTARARALADPNFIPETDAGRLLTLHDNAVAAAAAKETFKLGAGGKTRAQVIEELHPELYRQYTGLRQKLESLRATASRLDDKSRAAIDDFLAKTDPEDVDFTELRADLNPTVGKPFGRENMPAGPNYGKGQKEIAQSIAAVKADIAELAPAWRTANTQPYVLNRSTFQFHTPEVSRSIDSVKRASNGVFDKVLEGADVARATVLGGDFSPLSIQGMLNILRDPLGSTKTMLGMIRHGSSGLDEVARAEPEMVSLYTQARNRALGDVGQEFSGGKSLIAKLPKVGEKFTAGEQHMFNVVQRMEYETWKRSYTLLKKFNPEMTDAVAAHEAASAISKSVPGLSTVERGLSPARGAVERGGITSTSFLASPALLMKDATSGLAKLVASGGHWESLRGREQIAIIQGFNIAATTLGLSVISAALSAESKGMDPLDAVKRALNHNNKEFMAIQFGDKFNIPIGGPFRSFIRGVAPRVVDGEIQPPDLLQFARSKLAPGARLATDFLPALTGQDPTDYMGNKILQGDALEKTWRALAYGAESLMPLTAGAVAQGLRTGEDWARIGINAAGQQLGTSPSMPSAYEQRDNAVRKEFGKTYAELDPLERVKWDREHGTIDATTDLGQRIQSIKQEAATKQAALESAFQNGSPGAKTIGEYNATRKSNADYTRGQYDAIAGSIPHEEREALTAYFAIWKQVETPFGAIDPEKFAQLEADWNKKYPDGQSKLQEYGLAKNDGPVEQARRTAMNTLANDGYFMGSTDPARPSMKRFRGMVSDLSEQKILEVQQEISNARTHDPVLSKIPFDAAAKIYMSEHGYDPLEILDVQNAGSKKYGAIEFIFYKADHPELMAWLNESLTYEDLKQIGAIP